MDLRLFEAFITKQFNNCSLKNKTTLNLKQSWIFSPLDYNVIWFKVAIQWTVYLGLRDMNFIASFLD